MSETRVYVDGELYLSLEVVAEVYELQVTWLREAYELGMLGVGACSGSTVCIAAVQMDRLSTIVRLHRVLGLDLETIELSLPSMPNGGVH